MKATTVFGRKPAPLLCSALLACSCITGYYYAYQANASLQPVLPPLAAQRHIQHWLNNPGRLQQQATLAQFDAIKTIYQANQYQLLWLDDYGLSKAGQALLQQLMETSADNIIHYPYHLNYIRQRLRYLGARPDDATALDIVLTDAFMAYAEDVLTGKLQPDKLNRQQNGLQHAKLPARDYREHIISLVADTQSQDRYQLMQAMVPSHEGYQRLRDALRQYQAIADSGIWQPMVSGPTLKLGDKHSQVTRLRQLLRAYGDYPQTASNTAADTHAFDATLAASLRRFQARHGKPVTGELDNTTRQLLNVSPALRIQQIALNMKRWRQLPNDLGRRHIWVNVPGFELQLMEDGKPSLSMKVIVGKTTRRTPLLQESINSVVLNPPWNVPKNIMWRDIVPQLQQDPEYLGKRNMRILQGWENAEEISPQTIDWAQLSPHNFPYRLQQAPGKDNALGKVKFVIPNDDSIYLHDTNRPDLFARDDRALSSGCIRVERPIDLAIALLSGEGGWSDTDINDLLEAGDTRHLRLPESVPTYFFYQTSWVDDTGQVHFRDDIYQQDAQILARDKPPQRLL